jgi:hypothetical protein
MGGGQSVDYSAATSLTTSMAMLNRAWICMQKHEYPHCDKQHGKKGRNPPCCLVHGRIAEWSDELGIGPIIIALFDTQASGEIRNQKRRLSMRGENSDEGCQAGSDAKHCDDDVNDFFGRIGQGRGLQNKDRRKASNVPLQSPC